ncbi:MAG: hypothetical protein LBB72_01735, partial [Spirochaetaceae bacterium]|nr:hypothetical protein [Spirochaetaceae bacterium]
MWIITAVHLDGKQGQEWRLTGITTLRVASKENLAEKSVPLPAAGRSKVEILAKGFSRNLVRRNT